MRRLVPAVLALAVAAGSACATSRAIDQARAAERTGEYDRAVVEYAKALRERPQDRELQLAFERAKIRAADAHFTRARRLASIGQYEEALTEYQLASELNPSNSKIADELGAIRAKLNTRLKVVREGKTELETLIEQSRSWPPPGLDLPKDVKLPDTLVFRNASSRDVLVSIARLAGINLVLDPAFRDAPVTLDLRGISLEDALTAVTSSTRSFYRVTAPRTVTVAPDTPAKRREYEEEVIRTFYLSNADLKETIDLLRIVVDNRRISPITATNAVTIKDTPERIAAAAKVIDAIDKARAEVVIEVELLEVDRTRLKEYGLQIASPNPAGPTGISGTVDVNREGFTLDNLLNLTQSDVFLTNLPTLYYRLLKSDVNTRTLANPQLRTSEGITAQARFGERVPVPITTFSPIATGGVPQQPITSFSYENIGVNIDITPRTHHNNEVSLALKVDVSNISGVGFGGLPTFGNRSISTTIRLRDGETNMLAGLIRDNERETVSGIPGLSDLPLVGRLFAHNRNEAQQTDIILTLTPRIIRVLELDEDDLRPFRVGRDTSVADVALPQPADSIEQPPTRREPPDGAPAQDDDDEEQAPAPSTPQPTAPPGEPGPILPPQPQRPSPPPPR